MPVFSVLPDGLSFYHSKLRQFYRIPLIAMSEDDQDQDQDQDHSRNHDHDQDKDKDQDQDQDQDNHQCHEQDQGDYDAPVVCDNCNTHAAVYWSDTSSMMLCDSNECIAHHTDLARIADVTLTPNPNLSDLGED
jgi:hypothetical protein